MILRERTKSSANALREALADRVAAEVTFVLDLSHLMMVRGRLNDREGLTFFVDSGLDSEAVLAAPIQTLEYLGTPETETEVSEEAVGGGGVKFASGLFDLDLVGLGELVQHQVRGEYGALTPETYWARGYIQDGLISHRFLRRYASWTIDFDSMTFLFGAAQVVRLRIQVAVASSGTRSAARAAGRIARPPPLRVPSRLHPCGDGQVAVVAVVLAAALTVGIAARIRLEVLYRVNGQAHRLDRLRQPAAPL